MYGGGKGIGFSHTPPFPFFPFLPFSAPFSFSLPLGVQVDWAFVPGLYPHVRIWYTDKDFITIVEEINQLFHHMEIFLIQS